MFARIPDRAFYSAEQAQLRISLFGGFQVWRQDQPIRSFRSDKARALLAYLALESQRRPVRREQLAALFWPGYLRTSALQSLRSALFDLRQLLEPLGLIEISYQDVRLSASSSDLWCDVLEVERLWAAVEKETTAGATANDAVARLAGLLQGEFLAGLTLPDAPGFTAWQHSRRERYAQIARRVEALTTAAGAGSRHNLPRPTTPFLGRGEELAVLRQKLLDPYYPLVTITGLGGVGKTRLALAVAEQVQHAFADGVWYVPLTGLGAAPAWQTQGQASALMSDQLASLIAAALGLDIAGRLSPVQHLLAHVQSRALLLLLDGYEGQAAGRDLLVQLVERAPRVKLLITARQRLGLHMEHVQAIGGLATPNELSVGHDVDGRLTIPDDASSVQLFVERADRTTAGFALTAANVADVIAICQAVEGLPLAIELAAALTDRYSCAEIVRLIRQGVDVLAQPAADRLPRHHSIRAVFEESWSALSPDQAAALTGCAVFRGGFTADAAGAILQAHPADLKYLLDTSHLSRDGVGRYHMHALLRQFVAQRQDRAMQHKLRERHSQHYLQPFEHSEPFYWHTASAAALRQLSQELGNIQDAWLWAIETRNLPLIARSLVGLSRFLNSAGLLTTGLALVGAACRELGDDEMPAFDRRDWLHSQLRVWHAYFLIQVGQYQQAIAEAEQGLAAAESAQDATAIAHALLILGWAWYYMGHSQRAYDFWTQGLAVCCTPETVHLRDYLLIALGRGAFRRGELAEARGYLAEAVASAQAMSDPFNEAMARLSLGSVHLNTGDYGAALVELAAPATAVLVARHELLAADLDNRLAQLYLTLGNYAAVPPLLERLTEAAMRLTRQELQVFGLVSRIRLNCALADYDAVLAATETALPLCRDYRPPYPLAIIQTQAGHAHLALGELALAEAMYRAALETWQRHEFLDRKAEHLAAVAGLIEAALARDDASRAAALAEEAAAQLGAAFAFRPAHTEPLRIYLACHRAWAAVGDPRAAEILAAAADILRRQAAGIPDAALRRAFLEQVAVNREILRLAAT